MVKMEWNITKLVEEIANEKYISCSGTSNIKIHYLYLKNGEVYVIRKVYHISAGCKGTIVCTNKIFEKDNFSEIDIEKTITEIYPPKRKKIKCEKFLRIVGKDGYYYNSFSEEFIKLTDSYLTYREYEKLSMREILTFYNYELEV
jgi:hypothetical protein